MPVNVILKTSFAIFFSWGLTSSCYASEGLSDLKQALIALEGTSEIKAELLTLEYRNRDEEDIKEGKVSVLLEDGNKGFTLGYSPEVLTKLSEEKKAEIMQNKLLKQGVEVAQPVKKPTTMAMNYLRPIQLRNLLSKSESLLSFIEQLTFIEEEASQVAGEALRLLTFSVAPEAIITDKKAREYVDEFEGLYRIWINKAGIPLKAELVFIGSGSAYLIFSMESEQIIKERYQLFDDRLVVINSEYESKNTHTFGSMHLKTDKQLNVISSTNKKVDSNNKHYSEIQIGE